MATLKLPLDKKILLYVFVTALNKIICDKNVHYLSGKFKKDKDFF